MIAPSACNSRPWEFIAVTKREVLDDIAKIHPYAGMCKTASAAIIIVAVPQTGRPEGYFPQDCAAATQNIMLEATALGLGTCWCGIYPKENRMKALSELLGITEPNIPISLIAIGYADETPKQRGFFDKSKVTYIT